MPSGYKRSSMYNKNTQYNRKRSVKKSGWRSIMRVNNGNRYANRRGAIGYFGRQLGLIKNQMNTEVKYIDNLATSGVVTPTGTMTCITLLGQGTTDLTRVGNSILAKHLVYRFDSVNSSIDAANILRTIIFIDKNDPNNVAPTSTDLLESADITSMANKNNMDRFVILRDEIVETSQAAGAPRKAYRKGYVNLSRLHIKYKGTTSLLSACAQNQIWVFQISENANGPTSLFNPRIAFYDN